MFHEFHNGIPGLLCACWVHWLVKVIDGEHGQNGENRDNGEHHHNGENAPPINLHAFWMTLGSPGARSPHLELIPLPKGS